MFNYDDSVAYEMNEADLREDYELALQTQPKLAKRMHDLGESYDAGMSINDNPFHDAGVRSYPSPYSKWYDGYRNRRDGAE